MAPDGQSRRAASEGNASLVDELPRPVALPSQPLRTGYRRDYEAKSHRAGCLIQQVGVEIVYYVAGQWLVSYRSRYHEYFELDDGAALVVDRHDFDLVRDGWRQTTIEELRQKWLAAADRPKLRGAAQLKVRKSFLLGRGRVCGGRPVELQPGSRFGFLQRLQGRLGRARILLRAGTGRPAIELPGIQPWPFRGTAAGSGNLVGGWAWRAIERYRYDFGCLAGRLQEDPGYCQVSLPARVTT